MVLTGEALRDRHTDPVWTVEVQHVDNDPVWTVEVQHVDNDPPRVDSGGTAR